MRTSMAGIAGAIAMFIWATVAHTLTPLASIGLQPLPGEATIIATLHQSLGDKPGLYFFPFAGTDAKSMAAEEAKLKVEPHGLIVYQPPGTTGLSPRQLVIEFGLELIEAILAAVVLSFAAGFSRRVGMAALIGVIAAMATNLSYWNWYGFSLDYTLANAFVELMKFVFAGVAIAAVLGWKGRTSAPAV